MKVTARTLKSLRYRRSIKKLRENGYLEFSDQLKLGLKRNGLYYLKHRIITDCAVAPDGKSVWVKIRELSEDEIREERIIYGRRKLPIPSSFLYLKA